MFIKSANYTKTNIGGYLNKTIIDDGFRYELVEGAEFEEPFDIPIIKPLPDDIPLPRSLIPFDKRHQTNNFNQWVHCYLFDFRFKQLITNTEKHMEIIRKFDGFITPDPSLYRDMPLSPQIANTYLNRAVGHYMQRMGIPTIVNIRWSTEKSFPFAFLGAPHNSTIATSNHGSLRGKENLYWFELGFDEMVNQLTPKRVILHGNITNGLQERYPELEIALYPSEFSSSRRRNT